MLEDTQSQLSSLSKLDKLRIYQNTQFAYPFKCDEGHILEPISSGLGGGGIALRCPYDQYIQSLGWEDLDATIMMVDFYIQNKDLYPWANDNDSLDAS